MKHYWEALLLITLSDLDCKDIMLCIWDSNGESLCRLKPVVYYYLRKSPNSPVNSVIFEDILVILIIVNPRFRKKIQGARQRQSQLLFSSMHLCCVDIVIRQRCLAITGWSRNNEKEKAKWNM